MRLFTALVLTAMIMVPFGCQTAPKTEEKKEALTQNADATLMAMKADDPSFERFVNNAYGYVVFPSVGKGGLGVGGAYGRGAVFEQGRQIGWADITQLTVGLQAGGQSFAQVICFENKAALDRFVTQKFELGAQASAVALKSGAAANAKYADGIAIFTHVRGGLMAEASVGGQSFSFSPLR